MGRGNSSESTLVARRSPTRYTSIVPCSKSEVAEVAEIHAPFIDWYSARDGAHWPPPLIRDDHAVAALADELQRLSPRVVALDLETASRGYSNSREVVHGSIRLAQLAVDDPEEGIAPQQWLIDLHAVDASPVLALLADPAIETQVFNLQFEVEKLASRLGIEIGNVYDPCLAWRYIQKKMAELDEEARARLGFAGLAKRERSNWATPFFENKLSVLTPKLLGFALAKEDQESDWGAETLSEGQLLYATVDVAALPALAERTKAVAEQLGLTSAIAAKTEQARTKILDELRTIDAVDEADRLAAQLALARSSDDLERAWEGRRQLAISHRSLLSLEALYEELRADRLAAAPLLAAA
jgi:ribonuclease D